MKNKQKLYTIVPENHLESIQKIIELFPGERTIRNPVPGNKGLVGMQSRNYSTKKLTLESKTKS